MIRKQFCETFPASDSLINVLNEQNEYGATADDHLLLRKLQNKDSLNSYHAKRQKLTIIHD